MTSEELTNITDFLGGVPFFSEVNRTSLKQLCTDLKVLNFGPKETVFKKGEPGDAMYVILNGEVNVHEDDHLYGVLGEAECFGEYALIDRDMRSATITTRTATRVLEIPRDHFTKLLNSDHGLVQGMLTVLIKRHRDLDDTQKDLASSKEALSLANAKMSGLINGAMDAIIMFDGQFRILLTNPAADELLENDDALQRNILFFFDDETAARIETLVKENKPDSFNRHLSELVTVIGSNETRTINEGTISKYGSDTETFYTLILRNIADRLEAEDTISLLQSQRSYLEEEIKELTSTYGILAEDQKMLKVLDQIKQVAHTDATVLITGETGTGKELVARAIHMASDRNEKPLIRVNCGAIPANLIESELFGHEKGAFTGATASRKGRFLLADEGTIFLDEIGELPIDLQPKLLRVIQEGELDPVGSSETVKVNVRILAATHRDLLQHAAEGKFREDLFYRLNVFPIDVPPLRERGNDVCLIAGEMIRQFSGKLGKQPTAFTEDDQELFAAYHWPGNVRELQNLVERAVIISTKGMVNWEHIIPSTTISSTETNTEEKTNRILTSMELVTFEKENILRALRKTGWKVSGKNGAAELLKMAPTTLASRMKALGISRPV